MAKGFKHGAGGVNPLNFKVVGGAMPFGYINCKDVVVIGNKVSVSNVSEKRITVTADGAEYRCASYDFDVLPGQVLTFSAEVESGYTGYPCLGLRKYENGSFVAILVGSSASIVDGKISLTYTVPAGVTKMRLELFCSWTPAGSGSVTYKNVMMGSSTENAKENMVWVNTDVNIHRWDFSAREPQLVSNSKNLLPQLVLSSEADPALTYTFNNDGTIAINGTPSKQAYFAEAFRAVLPAGTYTMSGNPTANSTIGTNDMIVYAQPMGSSEWNMMARSYGSVQGTFTLEETSYIWVRCRTNTGATYKNTVWYPMIRKASESAGYVPFDATGQVWISTGTGSPAEFNALKKNGICISPMAAKQYIGGAWVSKPAKIYKNDLWTDWWNGILWDLGIEHDYVTGGYAADSTSNVTINSDGSRTYKGSGNPSRRYTKNKINLSGFTTLHFQGLIYDNGVNSAATNANNAAVAIWSAIGATHADNRVACIMYSGSTEHEYTLDISGLVGEYYIGWYSIDKYSYIKAYKLWLT